MRVLLDTCVLLRALEDSPRLSERARTVLTDLGNDCWISSASVWEIAIKLALGKHRLEFPLSELESAIAETGFRSLDVTVRAFGVDAREEEQVVALVDTIEREVGPIEVAVYNIGANVCFPIGETTHGCFAGSGNRPAGSRAHRRSLLATACAAAHRVDTGVGPASVDRALLNA